MRIQIGEIGAGARTDLQHCAQKIMEEPLFVGGHVILGRATEAGKAPREEPLAERACSPENLTSPLLAVRHHPQR